MSAVAGSPPDANPTRVWTVARAPSPVVFVTQVGAATGARAAAAALACTASGPDRAALLVVFSGNRAPRPTLIASAAARALEERLIAHLPGAQIASRGQICQLTLPTSREGIAQAAAALPLVRESTAVIHLSPPLLRPLLAEPRIKPTAALLRADLATDHPLTALAVRDLLDNGLRVAVLKHPLGWLQARAGALGVLPVAANPLPARTRERLLGTDDKTSQQCYDGKDGSESDGEQPHASTRKRVADAPGWSGAWRSRESSDA